MNVVNVVNVVNVEELGRDYDERFPLARREWEVLFLASRGLTALEIAGLLGSTYETVKTQRKQVLVKLDARNMVEAVAIAFRRGLIA